MCCRGYQQQDAHEFLRYMLDRLHTELLHLLPDTPYLLGHKGRSSIVSSVFGGTLQSEVRLSLTHQPCLQCETNYLLLLFLPSCKFNVKSYSFILKHPLCDKGGFIFIQEKFLMPPLLSRLQCELNVFSFGNSIKVVSIKERASYFVLLSPVCTSPKIYIILYPCIYQSIVLSSFKIKSLGLSFHYNITFTNRIFVQKYYIYTKAIQQVTLV